MGKGRRPCCDKERVKKGPWSEVEDLMLISFIQKHGHSNWRALPKLAGLARCGKSCRLRWVNYLRPDVKRGSFTFEEEEAIIKLHETLGNKWSKIASHFPGRTDNEIKNVWNTHLKKRIKGKNSSLNNDAKEENTKECPKQQLHATNQASPIDDMTIDIEHSSSSSTSSSSETSFLTPNHQMTEVNKRLHQEGENPSSDVSGKDESEIDVDKMKEDAPMSEDLIEIPFEPHLDLWNLLDDDFSISANTHELVQLKELDAENDMKYNYVEDGGSWPWWLIYLENELGFDYF
ncbi:hypothetical protein Cgig2_022228 [Carnegiea gigantea]|uniref:Uncharacterized protein n=1 Tax=Carnegiea gigantea TaxID=171969 RepID=A0A9Q1KHJ2_9CARY|nr:hypothetical protein Cgig2_022228 [Carnegiea gigantea]